jgi:predicted nucleic acid-binding protein
VNASRDERDDKFLDVAVNGGARWLVSGDADLLVLDPFRGVRSFRPARMLDELGPLVGT